MTDWRTYLAGFHARNPGITEAVLRRARSGGLTPYTWLARAVSGDRVLDLACGNSAMAATLAEDRSRTTQPWVVGVDTSEAELRAGRERGRGGPLVRADVGALPFAGGSFDAVVSSLGLVVAEELDGVLAEVARVLRHGGVLAATVPSAVPLRAQDMRLLPPLTARLRTTPQFPAGGEMTGLGTSLEAAGFRVLEDARERFAFVVRTLEDADLLMRSLYLPDTPDRRRDSAASWLAARAAGAGGEGVEVATPIRRVVAMKSVESDVGGLQ
ncbi:MAG: methyltransferase domain-containing protein [Propionibacteriales bacterium]|nr:methyltransferase domain-containing protein [Propionibacteriales bacterium]